VLKLATRYDFQERLRFSNGYLKGGIGRILLARVPGALQVVKADVQADRHGTDYWVERGNGKSLAVDVKVREQDFAPEYDDLALETWSVIGQRVGWTRDSDKLTDYVLWFWASTGRFFLADFPCLCKVFERYWQRWAGTYQVAKQNSVQGGRSWQSQCVFVPRLLVMEKMSAWQHGSITLPCNSNPATRTPDFIVDAALFTQGSIV